MKIDGKSVVNKNEQFLCDSSTLILRCCVFPGHCLWFGIKINPPISNDNSHTDMMMVIIIITNIRSTTMHNQKSSGGIRTTISIKNSIHSSTTCLYIYNYEMTSDMAGFTEQLPWIRPFPHNT